MNLKGKDGNIDNTFYTVYLNPWEEEANYGNLIKFDHYTIKKSKYKETTKSTTSPTTSWTTTKSSTSSTTSWTPTKSSTSWKERENADDLTGATLEN